ncbi:MAG TPA: GNAT family N-acetyltransferase [Nocardioidaceae bacterium]|nr:GNAT family N-acetyltransferase [Nocardioidaceae bacterium]
MTDGGFALRLAAAGDAEFLADMLVEAVNWDPRRPAVSRERVVATRETVRYVAGWPRSGELGVVAVDSGGGPIGAAWLRQFAAADPGYGFVAPEVPELSVGVLPPWRGRGVGGSLIDELARRAAAAGIARISLSVERANRARALYVRAGFTTVESGPDADTMVIMLAP